MKKFTLALLMTVVIGLLGFSPLAVAQNNVSGDITGTVTDSTGALLPGAKVILTFPKTGAVKTETTNASGGFRFSLLEPGLYHLTYSSTGFNTTATDIQVSAGVVFNANEKLTVGSSGVVVEVTGESPLLHTESAEISTEFSQEQISTLPNPGNDLTFIAQTTPGAVMNTQGGYGNFSSFGLPATANTFTVNGGYENDPFLNVNNSGATNLLLGNNDIGTVTVLSNAYGAQYGGLGGTQINEQTRSGGNKFHGDATYQWNGSVLNGNDYFNNQSGTKRPRSNANQWSGAIGGPIVKDKTFFFFNTEGLRVVIPVRAPIYAPSAQFIATTLANVASQGAAAVNFYKGYFNTYTSLPGYATAIPVTTDPSDYGPPSACAPVATAACVPNTVTFPGNSANFAHEVQYTGRVDQVFGAKDTAFVHYTYDNGVQPTFTSLLNPIFDTNSPQPQWQGQFNETHIFTPNITNQFVIAQIYYKAVFQNTNATAANAIFPGSIEFLDGGMSSDGFGETPGGEDFVFPQGRRVNGYQFSDDFSITHGKHTFKTGFYLRRDNVTDLSPQVENVPIAVTYWEDFEAGTSTVYQQQFPTRGEQPVSVYNFGAYVQDEWKLSPEFIATVGIRFEHNSNPVCHTSCFDQLSGPFSSLSTSPNTPYDNNTGKGLINSGLYTAFSNFEKVGYEPRIGFAYTPVALGSKTVFSGGFGIFADAFPAQVADTLLNNAPTNIGFTLYGGPGVPLYAGAAGSLQSIGKSSAASFQSGYKAGGTYNSLGIAPPNFASPLNKVYYPTYEEYNLQVQQQIGKSVTVNLDYVGNHSYHQPVNNSSVNAWNQYGAPGFPTLSTVQAPNPNFAEVTQIYSGASSNYNGLALSVIKRSTWLTLQFNYTYSHALDEISNGGFDGFSGNSINPDNPNLSLLRQNYGNADYDTRNYISSNYVFNLPYYGGPKALTKGWELAGTVFHSSGLPFTFTDAATAGNFGNYGGALFAQQTVAHIPKKCSSYNIQNAAGGGTPCSAANDVTSATNFGQQERNQVFGPSYTDTDMSLFKSFDMPKYDTVHLKLGVQAFNLLNHPNFAQPAHDLSNSNLGLISGTVNPPTSILGSFLGGDASPRLIQLKANINF